MGAGLSGLACAITLEKHGISPAVFEVRERLGDRFVNAESMLSILQKPITDPVAFSRRKTAFTSSRLRASKGCWCSRRAKRRKSKEVWDLSITAADMSTLLKGSSAGR
ncbi:NAD(P)-binding protein [Brevibacillus borstelensis]|nr:NAD(P)-binding protein [Brevibacillus borstelensis]MCC0562950.1 NAD(P)-binding protein [Brevibacillus borstelensis]